MGTDLDPVGDFHAEPIEQPVVCMLQAGKQSCLGVGEAYSSLSARPEFNDADGLGMTTLYVGGILSLRHENLGEEWVGW